MGRSTMTVWETRGYLTYPNQYGKPAPGTNEETLWARGWSKAQREANLEATSDYHKQLSDDYYAGRDSFAASYGDKNNLQF